MRVLLAVLVVLLMASPAAADRVATTFVAIADVTATNAAVLVSAASSNRVSLICTNTSAAESIRFGNQAAVTSIGVQVGPQSTIVLLTSADVYVSRVGAVNVTVTCSEERNAVTMSLAYPRLLTEAAYQTDTGNIAMGLKSGTGRSNKIRLSCAVTSAVAARFGGSGLTDSPCSICTPNRGVVIYPGSLIVLTGTYTPFATTAVNGSMVTVNCATEGL